MKKISKKTQDRIKKAVPIVISGTVLLLGGVLIYKKGLNRGFSEGVAKGIERSKMILADFLSTPNAFAVYDSTKNVPIFITGLPFTCKDDAVKAIKMMDAVSPLNDHEKLVDLLVSKFNLV
jgi:hypothetical protein